eukprot:1941004-Pyramimonas_sp.AAC.1
MHDPDPGKTKVARKVARVIIENAGGDGGETNKHIGTNHTQGVVWWKDSRIADWDVRQGKMQLMGATTEFQN